MDHLAALKVFRHVVELHSFAGAARRSGLSPAAISKTVGALEAHLGVRLLNRTTRQMSLTEAGALYYERIARILDELDEADRSLGPMLVEPSGVLRVSAPLTLTLTCLSAAIPRFLDRHPAISLDLNMDDRRVDVVRDGYDLALRGSAALEDSSLVARKLMAMPHVVCAAPAYWQRRGVPAVPEDLAAHSSIQFSLSSHVGLWEFRQAGRTARVAIDGRYKVTSSLAVRDALLAGFGLSLIPRLYVQADLQAGRLVTALDDWAAVETSVYAIYPSRRHIPAKVRAFLDFLTAELGTPAA